MRETIKLISQVVGALATVAIAVLAVLTLSLFELPKFVSNDVAGEPLTRGSLFRLLESDDHVCWVVSWEVTEDIRDGSAHFKCGTVMGDWLEWRLKNL